MSKTNLFGFLAAHSLKSVPTQGVEMSTLTSVVAVRPLR